MSIRRSQDSAWLEYFSKTRDMYRGTLGIVLLSTERNRGGEKIMMMMMSVEPGLIRKVRRRYRDLMRGWVPREPAKRVHARDR